MPKEEPFSRIVNAVIFVPEQWHIHAEQKVNEKLIEPPHAGPSAKIICPNIAHSVKLPCVM